MASIENIPPITASFSGGGSVFSIDFQRSYSQEASKVTYRIVSESGSYSNPTIGASASISFGDFNFTGYVYSYELEESASSGKILTVTLVDQSVILDKLYVCVFRRGLFGENGTKKTESYEVKFEDQEAFWYLQQNSTGGFDLIKKDYVNEQVDRFYYEAKVKRGDIIIVGSEIVSDQECELLDSSYTFEQLKSAVGGAVSGFSSAPISSSDIAQTYEGTLRSVLNSWCQDFGFTFYWDYSANTLKFIDLKSGVMSLPDSSDKKILSKKTFKSAEGMFNQVACNYFARPFNPRTETVSLSKTVYNEFEIWPFSVSFFVNRYNDEIGTENDSSAFGSKRTQSEFLKSAICGYISPTLRKVYNFSLLNKIGASVGIRQWRVAENAAAVTQVFDSLELDGFEVDVAELRNFAGMAGNDSTPDAYYHVILASLDAGLEDSWNTVEQDILTDKIGNYYKSTYNVSRTSVFCSPTQIVKTSITYEPEGTLSNDKDQEDADQDPLAGRRVFSRGAPGPDISPNLALKELGLDEEDSADAGGGGGTGGGGDPGGSSGSNGSLAKRLSFCVPLELRILEGGALDDVIQNELGASLSDYNTVLIYPTKKLVKDKTGLNVNSANSSVNKKEVTRQDIINEKQEDLNEECQELEDPNAELCLSAKEEVMKKQREQAEGDQTYLMNEPIAGLNSNNKTYGASISLDSGNTRLVTSSYSSYHSYQTFNFSVEALFTQNETEQFVSKVSGNTSSSPKIIETRVFIENRTDKKSLSKENLAPDDLSTREGYLQDKELQKKVFVCAGFVSSLPTSPASGLESIGMSLTDSGFEVTYSYSTRPGVFAKQDFSVISGGASSYKPASQIKYS